MILTMLTGEPPVFATVDVLVTLDFPTAMLPIARLGGVRVIAGVAPSPESANVCVPALSVRVRVPFVVPAPPGLKVTLTTQLFCGEAPIVVPHELVCEKPVVVVIPDNVIAVPVVFVTTTFRAPLATPTGCGSKVSDAGSMTTPADTPVPLMVTICGLPGALSVNFSVPEAGPVVVGLNRTETVQLAPGAREPPQVLVAENPALATMPLIVNVAVPLLITLTVSTELTFPTCWS